MHFSQTFLLAAAAATALANTPAGSRYAAEKGFYGYQAPKEFGPSPLSAREAEAEAEASRPEHAQHGHWARDASYRPSYAHDGYGHMARDAYRPTELEQHGHWARDAEASFRPEHQSEHGHCTRDAEADASYRPGHQGSHGHFARDAEAEAAISQPGFNPLREPIHHGRDAEAEAEAMRNGFIPLREPVHHAREAFEPSTVDPKIPAWQFQESGEHNHEHEQEARSIHEGWVPLREPGHVRPMQARDAEPENQQGWTEHVPGRGASGFLSKVSQTIKEAVMPTGDLRSHSERDVRVQGKKAPLAGSKKAGGWGFPW
ncbi:hypothetical protein LTR62_007667 [Meristemomyces frigidus]|uniref:Uncharacterized protein n=1 Tax=Meristemomyces frigidus TaxID=1508187 RepID=A0AAN7YHQ3_9PEZI|nr:hypothetical protein LTR62_007667 [Meristemomyces frigidus]